VVLKQTLLLASTLVLVLGCGSGSPEPTLYAPDDLASVLPQQVGDITLEVEGSGGSDYLVETLGEDALDMLLKTHAGLGYDPDEVRFALASSSTAPDVPRLVVFAVRVPGVRSWALGASNDNPLLVSEPEAYDSFLTEIPRADGWWYYVYPFGEVLFGAVATSDGLGITSDDVKAALPTCQRKGKEYQEPCHAPS
jgi:hypothetical protein